MPFSDSHSQNAHNGRARRARSLCLSLSLLSIAVGTALPAGAQTSTQFTQVVQQAIPVLQWAPPSSIAVGDPLSSIELNATANVPGVFVYTPAVGTQLPTGTANLSVTFTPEDSNYQAITETRAVLVQQADTGDFAFDISKLQSSVSRTAQSTDAMMQFSLVPLGSLNQVVHLSCAATPGVTCTFSPADLRSTSGESPVQLSVHVPASLLSIYGASLAPLTVAALAATRRRKRRWLRTANLLLLMLACICSLGGCGSARPLEVTVVARTSSLTHLMPLDLHQIGILP